MSLEDFLPNGEARVLWSRFESLVGQQVFRLRIEGEAANIPTSLCSLLSCNLSSPERISHLDPACIQSGHLQRNTNALEIDKQPLYGLPYIAQSVCPLLRLILLTMQELRCLDRNMNTREALEGLKNIKRSLLDVHKKALLLESQLHQYVNPTLVTTLNRRTAKATFESELMCKLIDKLRKDSRQSASDPEKRKRVCELTMKLKSLLLRQKCEWQCVGRLKETIAMARDMKGVLKFICQLSCLLEHCSDASRRLTERPPPYEYCSSYDSTSKQDSSDALYEDLKRTDNHGRPSQSHSSHSEVTISLSLDFTSDKDFCEKSYESDSYADERASNSRQRHTSSRSFKDDKSESDALTVCSRKGRKVKEECLRAMKKLSRSQNKKSKSTSPVSSTKSGRRSRKHGDGQGKSLHTTSDYSTMEMTVQLPVQSKINYSHGSKSSSPKKSLLSNKRSQKSSILAEETINELIEVLEDYVENRSEAGRRKSSLGPEHKSGDLSLSEHRSKQTDSKMCNNLSRLSPSRINHQYEPFRRSTLQFATISSVPSNLQSSRSVKKQIASICRRIDDFGTKSYISGEENLTKPGYSMSGLNESRLVKKIDNESRLSKQTYDEGTMTRKSPFEYQSKKDSFNAAETITEDPNETRFSKLGLEDIIINPEGNFDEARMSKQDEANMSRKSSNDIILTEHTNATRSGEQDAEDTIMSKRDLDDAIMSKRDLDDTKMSKSDLDDTRMSKSDLDDTRMSKKDLDDTRMSKSDLDDTRMSKRDLDDTRMSKKDLDDTRMSKSDLDDTRMSKKDLDDTILSKRDLDDTRMSQRDLNDTRMSKQDIDETSNRKQDLDESRMRKRYLDKTRMSEQDIDDTSNSKSDLDETRMRKEDLDEIMRKDVDEIRMCRKSFNENRLNQQNFNETKLSGQNDNEVRVSHQSNAELSNKNTEQTNVSKNVFYVAKNNLISTRMSHHDHNFTELCKQSSYGSKIGLNENKVRDVALNEAQKLKNESCALAHKQCLEQIKMGIKNLKQTRMSEMGNDEDIVNKNYIGRSKFSQNNTDIAGLELKKQLAVECANVVQSRVANSSPFSDNRWIIVRKGTCKSTSPPRARREESDQICSSYEKSRNSTLKSESYKNGAEMAGRCKERLGKLKNNVVGSKINHLSPNTCSEDHEHETDYDNNIDDMSTNKSSLHNKKDRHNSPKQLQRNKRNKCSNRRASSLTSRKSESSKYYMRPRYNSSDSSGSREPLLFSSQETDLSFDDCSVFSYKMAKLPISKEKRKQSLRPNNRYFAGSDSELLDYTTTTTDSCALDDAITSSRKSSTKGGSSRQRRSTKTHSVDDTEGDIDQEIDLEEELEQDQLLQNRSDSDLYILENENQPSGHSLKPESHRSKHYSFIRNADLHHKYSMSQPSTKPSESHQSKCSTCIPSGRASSINESLMKIERRGSRRGKIPTKNHASTFKTSLYHPNDDRADGQEDCRNHFRSQPDCCSCVRQFTVFEDLLPTHTNCNIFTNMQSRLKQNQNFETDLAKLRLSCICSPILSPKLEGGITNKLSLTESRKSPNYSPINHSPSMKGDSGILRKQSQLSAVKAQSQLQSKLSANSHLTRSVQTELSAASIKSQLLTQSASKFGQPPQQENSMLAQSSIAEQPVVYNAPSTSIHPYSSVYGDSSLVLQQSQSPEILEQASIWTASSVVAYPTTSVHRDPSLVLQQSQMSAQSSGILGQGSVRTASLSNAYPTTSVHGDPSLALQQSYISEQSSGIVEKSLARTSSSAFPYPPTSVHEDPSVTLHQPHISVQSPGMLEQALIKTSYPAIPYVYTPGNRDPSLALHESRTSVHSQFTQISSEEKQKQSNTTQTSAKNSQLFTRGSNNEELIIENQDSPKKAWQPKSQEDASLRQSPRLAMSGMSRHSPFQSDVPGTFRHSQLPADFHDLSEQPLSPAGKSKQSVVPSEYSLTSRNSPTKSRQSVATLKSITPEEFEINSDAHSEASQSSNRRSKQRVSVNPTSEVYDGSESEHIETLYSLPSSSTSLSTKDSGDFYTKLIPWIPLILILLLLLLYYLICYLASIGGCVGCRAPLPNIFFYLMNSAVHSVRLTHYVPAPL